MDAKELIENILDRWNSAIQADLEHGVRWLNEVAAKEFETRYPALCDFGEYLSDLEDALNPGE